MKVEYLQDGSSESPLVRLYDFTAAEAQRLKTACHQMAEGQIDGFDLHAQAWVKSVGGFRLSLRTGSRDTGLMEESGGFTWTLRRQTWDNIEGLIEPFADGSPGFQWIDENGDVLLLISCTGCW